MKHRQKVTLRVLGGAPGAGPEACRAAQELFFEAPGDLTPEERLLLAAHEAACPACRAEFARWQLVKSVLREMQGMLSAPPGFAAAVSARIAALGEPKRALRFPATWKQGLAAAGIAFALLAGSLGALEKLHEPEPGTRIARHEPAAPRSREAEPRKGTEAPAPGAIPETPAPKDEAAATPGSPEEKPRAPTPGSQQAAETPAPEPGGTAVPGGGEVSLLSKELTLTTTVLKIEVADSAEARRIALAAAAAAGATLTSEATAHEGATTNVILRFSVPAERAGAFTARLAALGSVRKQETSTQDLTANYRRTFEEYQALQAQLAAAPEAERPRLEAELDFLARQLASYEKEAGKHVVVAWLRE